LSAFQCIGLYDPHVKLYTLLNGNWTLAITFHDHHQVPT
jgi:hypothetical protein